MSKMIGNHIARKPATPEITADSGIEAVNNGCEMTYKRGMIQNAKLPWGGKGLTASGASFLRRGTSRRR
jgi:hypothetical protein